MGAARQGPKGRVERGREAGSGCTIALALLCCALGGLGGKAHAQRVEATQERSRGGVSVRCDRGGDGLEVELIAPPVVKEELVSRVRAYFDGVHRVRDDVLFKVVDGGEYGSTFFDVNGVASCSTVADIVVPRSSVVEKAIGDQTLSSAEVAADRARLEGLWGLTRSSMPNGDHPTQVTYTFGSACGDVAGFVSSTKADRLNNTTSAEKFLRFLIGYDVSAARGPLRVASGVQVVRDDSMTAFVANTDVYKMSLLFSPAGRSVSLSNVSGSGAADVVYSSGLLAPAHCKFSARDLEVFRKLGERSLRGFICDNLNLGNTSCADLGLLVYRAEGANTYYADLHGRMPDGADVGLFPIKMSVSYGADGKMDIIRIEKDPARQTVQKQAILKVTHPVAPGVIYSAFDPGFTSLSSYDSTTFATSLASELFSNTSWR